MPNDVSTFIAKLLSSLRETVGNDKFGEIVRQARAYAGGVEKAKRRRANPGGGGAGAGGKCSEDVASHASDPGRRLFLSEISLAEDGRTGIVQIFPEEGIYRHPWYGDLIMDAAFFTDIKHNFDARVYQQDIPITVNLEHESSRSGAVGWFTELELREEGLGLDHKYQGMWARIRFNDRGTQFVSGDQYRYFSSEFYPEWVDPATSEVFKNVLVGGALTNRPFFKGMEPVALLTETQVFLHSEIAPFEDVFETALEYLSTHPEASLDEVVNALINTQEQERPDGDEGQARDADAEGHAEGDAEEEDADESRSQDPQVNQERVDRAPAADKETNGMNEEETRKFNEALTRLADLQATVASEKTLREAAEQKAEAADQRAKRVEDADNRRQLTEIVKLNRAAFKGETDAVVDRLAALKAKLSEDEWAAFIDERREIHASVSEALAFKQAAHEGEAPKDDTIATLVKTKLSENPGMTKAAAYKAVLSENPKLYEAENRKRNRAAVLGEREN